MKKAAAVFGGERDSSRKLTLAIADFSACDTVTTVTVVIVNKDTAATGGNEFFNFSLAGGTFFNGNVTGIKNFTSGTTPVIDSVDILTLLLTYKASSLIKRTFACDTTICTKQVLHEEQE